MLFINIIIIIIQCFALCLSTEQMCLLLQSGCIFDSETEVSTVLMLTDGLGSVRAFIILKGQNCVQTGIFLWKCFLLCFCF